jgi:hypothetical protein
MVIIACNCTKEKRQITQIHFRYLFGFNIGYSCWTRDVFLYGRVQWLQLGENGRKKLKIKHHLLMNGEHMPITLCHLDYAML